MGYVSFREGILKKKGCFWKMCVCFFNTRKTGLNWGKRLNQYGFSWIFPTTRPPLKNVRLATTPSIPSELSSRTGVRLDVYFDGMQALGMSFLESGAPFPSQVFSSLALAFFYGQNA